MNKKTPSTKPPVIIGFSGISGAGKSTLIELLAKSLSATTIFWDDYDTISKVPPDYVKWYTSGKNYDEWVYDDLAATLSKLKAHQTVTCPATKKKLHPTEYILFDSPLGYLHKATGKYIDFLVCLDTPPDIALARRLLRDHKHQQQPEKILEDLQHYLTYSRPLFILSAEEKAADLILDGSLPLEKQHKLVLTAIRNAKS